MKNITLILGSLLLAACGDLPLSDVASADLHGNDDSNASVMVSGTGYAGEINYASDQDWFVYNNAFERFKISYAVRNTGESPLTVVQWVSGTGGSFWPNYSETTVWPGEEQRFNVWPDSNTESAGIYIEGEPQGVYYVSCWAN